MWTVLAQRNISQPLLLENSILLTKLLTVLDVCVGGCSRLLVAFLKWLFIRDPILITTVKRWMKYCKALILQQLINRMSSSCESALNPWKSSGIIRILLLYFSDFHVMDIQTKFALKRKVYVCRKKKRQINTAVLL